MEQQDVFYESAEYIETVCAIVLGRTVPII